MRSLVVGVLAGCSPVALRDTPVLGGTAEQRERVRSELAAFQDAVGPERLSVRSVKIVERIRNLDDVAGSYRDHRVWLTADDDALTLTLRHELCHAVRDADDLLDAPDPLLDTLAAGLFDTEPYAEALSRHYRTARRQRSEAMAAFCELGPVALAALRDPCPGEPPLAGDVAAWMLDTVYTDYVPTEPWVSDPDATVTLDAWSPYAPTVSATDLSGVVWVSGADGEDAVAAELADGRLVEAEVAAVPTVDEGPPLRGVYVEDGAGWSDGPAAARGFSGLNHLGISAPRLFVFDADVGDWRVVVDACEALPNETLFTADGQVWRSWTDGLTLKWGPLSP